MIKDLKEQRRHKELAHLEIGQFDNDFEVKYDLLPAIKLIAEIIDLMNEAIINYPWSDGKYEKYDLRKEVLESTEKLKAPLSGFY
ncbi:hypothetical protein EON73_04975 [bacterium]|nr:MAG: hypothetical protein EON73_04975 [bacterium]